MKQGYETPQMKVTMFAKEDILTASNLDNEIIYPFGDMTEVTGDLS